MQYRLLKPLTFNACRLSLTDEQANPRLHMLKSIGAGVYEPTALVQFKAGEVIGYDGPINKELSDAMETVTQVAEEIAPAKRRGRPPNVR